MNETGAQTAFARPMDEEAALERVGGERSLLVELAGMCLADTPIALEALHKALAGKDAKSLQRAAHKLKGSLLVLAADGASEAANHLEAVGASGMLDDAATALAALEREIERLRPALIELAESEVEPDLD
jgi:HPt (histidine-containing phosphotransfer) domain-containing protein